MNISNIRFSHLGGQICSQKASISVDGWSSHCTGSGRPISAILVGKIDRKKRQPRSTDGRVIAPALVDRFQPSWWAKLVAKGVNVNRRMVETLPGLGRPISAILVGKIGRKRRQSWSTEGRDIAPALVDRFQPSWWEKLVAKGVNLGRRKVETLHRLWSTDFSHLGGQNWSQKGSMSIDGWSRHCTGSGRPISAI